MIGILSTGIARIDHLSELLGEPWEPVGRTPPPHICKIAAWGRRPPALRARRYAQRWRLPFLTLEDGFLRALDPQDSPLSIVIDDLGIYYDASAPSRLEAWIKMPLTAAQQQRARALIQDWRRARVSKYNHAREYPGELPEPYVLVVDQTCGDASIRYGQADGHSFDTMLAAALAEYPTHTVVVKIHPEVLQGRKQGHFQLQALKRHPRIHVLGEDFHPVRLLERATAVYTVTSQMGFEGLLWGKPVRTFGMPFYAGWGLTEDEMAAPPRRQQVPLENLVHAALIAYPRYLDPETGKPCEVERLLAWLGLQRRMFERFPRQLYAMGFSYWKRPILRRFCQGSHIRFVSHPRHLPPGSTVMVWGCKTILPATVDAIRVEDGFLRSVGLGAELTRPLSWIMDRRGIHYRSDRPSDLEILLQESEFDPALLARARILRKRLVAAGLTKYNVDRRPWRRPTHARRVILVPGQVENDASIRYGAPGIRTNLDLLQTVRRENPDAYLLYKPHPDVAAGLRRPGSGERETRDWCDEVVGGADMAGLLTQVDEVHTLTSLSGFEALLRDCRVVCYGQPFYAGWGLTEDVIPLPRRTRRLTLDELVAGALILYPVYVSRITGRYTTPERALDELLAWRRHTAAHPSWWRGLWRRLVGCFNAP